MNLSTGRTQLYTAQKTLRLQWEEVRNDWNDPVSATFEEIFFLPLDNQVKTTLGAIDRLTSTLARLRQDCE